MFILKDYHFLRILYAQKNPLYIAPENPPPVFPHAGNLISTNENISNDYPHIVAENPKKELLYIRIRTEMHPTIPSVKSIKN